MSKRDMGGPAFPVPFKNESHHSHGMTLWDYYAAHGPADLAWCEDAMRRMGHDSMTGEGLAMAAANMNARYADAMLAGRAKRTGGDHD